MHLSNDDLLRLATLVVEDLPFSEKDVVQMQHIGECEECYEQLQIYMAVLSTVEYADNSSLSKGESEMVSADVNSAIISIMIVDARAIMEQLNSAQSNWLFEAAAASSRKRSTERESKQTYRLEDIESSETFLSYDESSGELLIQIDSRTSGTPARVYLRTISGEERDIPMERCEHLLCGTVKDLPKDRFEIILEK